MIVKIGPFMFDPNDQPLMAILTEPECNLIAKSKKKAGLKHMAGPGGMNATDISNFMNTHLGFYMISKITPQARGAYSILLLPKSVKPKRNH